MNQSSPTRIISPTFYDRDLEHRPLPRQQTDFWIGSFPDIPYLRICWSTKSRLQVLQHAYQTPEIEVGGVLLGNVYRSTDVGGVQDLPTDFIEIIEALQAPQTTAKVGSFNFPPEVWAQLNSTRDTLIQNGRLHPTTNIIGWYHTHPGHSVFLSPQDLFIHNNFFSRDFQIALVVDPQNHYGAFFVDSDRLNGPYKSYDFDWDLQIVSLHAMPIVPGQDIDQVEPAVVEPAVTPNIAISESELPVYPTADYTVYPAGSQTNKPVNVIMRSAVGMALLFLICSLSLLCYILVSWGFDEVFRDGIPQLANVLLFVFIIFVPVGLIFWIIMVLSPTTFNQLKQFFTIQRSPREDYGRNRNSNHRRR